MGMAHVVIVGAGLGGVPAALELRRALRREDRVTVIADRATFDFTPSNPWVAVGWRQPETIQIPLADVFARKKIEFVVQAVAGLRPGSSQLDLADGTVVDYDFLVIATGPELAFDEVPGLGPESFTRSICRLDHARTTADAWEAFLDRPGPVVVGAVQGASCFGPAYEFAYILDTILRRKKLRHRVPMTFVTSEPYVGHLGLEGVGDTKGMLESEFRDRDIRWIASARVNRVEDGKMIVEEVAPDGAIARTHELPFAFSMMLPAFRGVAPLKGVDGLVNPRGFVLVQPAQQNPTFRNVFAVGVCVAIPPVGAYAVPVGVPKTGFMIESMVRATAQNIRAMIDGSEPTYEATWNAVCLADFGDGGVAFVAMPQIPPRNVNWSAEGRWVHLAKAGFEKYFLDKVRRGVSEPFYERAVLDWLGITKVRETEPTA
jgi:sulfide:quinone oxidoreductase